MIHKGSQNPSFTNFYFITGYPPKLTPIETTSDKPTPKKRPENIILPPMSTITSPVDRLVSLPASPPQSAATDYGYGYSYANGYAYVYPYPQLVTPLTPYSGALSNFSCASPSSPQNYHLSSPGKQQADININQLQNEWPHDCGKVTGIVYGSSYQPSFSRSQQQLYRFHHSVCPPAPAEPKKRAISDASSTPAAKRAAIQHIQVDPIQLTASDYNQPPPIKQPVQKIVNKAPTSFPDPNMIVDMLSQIQITKDMAFLAEHDARFYTWCYCQYRLGKSHDFTKYGDISAYRCVSDECKFRINLAQVNEPGMLAVWRVIDIHGHSPGCKANAPLPSSHSNRLFSRKAHKNICRYINPMLARRTKNNLLAKVLMKGYGDQCDDFKKPKTWSLAVAEYENIPSDLNALWLYFYSNGVNTVDLLV